MNAINLTPVAQTHPAVDVQLVGYPNLNTAIVAGTPLNVNDAVEADNAVQVLTANLGKKEIECYARLHLIHF